MSPASFCEAPRSFSALRRLKTWLCSIVPWPMYAKLCHYLSCTSGYTKRIILVGKVLPANFEVQWCMVPCVWQNLNTIPIFMVKKTRILNISQRFTL